jgi:hypothetical protein
LPSLLDIPSLATTKAKDSMAISLTPDGVGYGATQRRLRGRHDDDLTMTTSKDQQLQKYVNQRREQQRRRGRRQEQYWQTLILFVAAFGLLIFTVFVLYQQSFKQSSRHHRQRLVSEEQDDDHEPKQYRAGQPLHHPELGGRLLQSKLQNRRRELSGRVVKDPF